MSGVATIAPGQGNPTDHSLAVPALFAAILFAAFVVRLWQLDTQSLWHDEGWSVFAAYTMLGPMGIRGMDVNAPPLFYMSIGVWLRLLGDSVWAMRLWSAVVGTLLVAVAGLIGRRWYGDRVGLLAAAFVAVNPILWVFSQEIRAYIPMPLAALILLILTDAFLFPKGGQIARRVWLWLPLVEIMALYAHNLSVPLVAWLNVTVIGVLLMRRDWRLLARWIGMQAILLIAYLPWLLTQRQTGGPLNTPPNVAPSLAWDIWQSYFTGIKPMLNTDPAVSPLVPLIAAFGGLTVVAILAALIRRPSARTWLLLSQVVLLPIFQLAIILAARIDFHPRYFIVGVPATLILIAVGVVRMAEGLLRGQRLRLARLALPVGAAGLAIAIFMAMARLLFSSPIYQHDDFRAIAERYAALPADAAIILPYGYEPSLDYYRARLPIAAKVIEVPFGSSFETIVAALRDGLHGVSRAEVLTWYQLPADLRGAFPCLIGAVAQKVDTFTVSGLTTDAYQIMPLALPALSAELEPIRVEFPSAGSLDAQALIRGNGGETGCLVTRWTIRENRAMDWRLAYGVYRDFGAQMERGDADILNNRGLPSSLWQDDEAHESFARTAPYDLWETGDRLLVSAHLYSLSGAKTPGRVIAELASDGASDAPARLQSVDWAGLRRFEPPEIAPADRVAARFGDATALIGVEITRGLDGKGLVIADGQPFVRLHWHALGTPALDYTVFVHLVAPDGQIIAQSDTEPMNGLRPTSTWAQGEYLADGHVLSYNVAGYRGPANLRIGLYNAATGERLRLRDGAEFATPPVEIEVR